MTEPKDAQLISELIKATHAGKIRWIPTARRGEFTASFKGKFSVLVAERFSSPSSTPSSESTRPPAEPTPPQVQPPNQKSNIYEALLRPYTSASNLPSYELTVEDDLGIVLLRVVDDSVGPLLDAARRSGFRVDKVIDEIIEEIRTR